ncbi:hypothetical protein Kpho02_34710 [Kitasatospora phosalacinea]|uniref:Uncharacterized protein n=1 Tax=Kitasatospora phosalacinea TaxID=2065 RepID=A0A9W6QAS3_9ACTN|nr:hypothetical protein Kpho02_34710 [Kitasatospora phosalacinea]
MLPETGSYAHSYTPGSDRANGRARIFPGGDPVPPDPVRLTGAQGGSRLGHMDEKPTGVEAEAEAEEQWVYVLEYRNTAKQPSWEEHLRA